MIEGILVVTFQRFWKHNGMQIIVGYGLREIRQLTSYKPENQPCRRSFLSWDGWNLIDLFKPTANLMIKNLSNWINK